jgi:polygalacturonase
MAVIAAAIFQNVIIDEKEAKQLQTEADTRWNGEEDEGAAVLCHWPATGRYNLYNISLIDGQNAHNRSKQMRLLLWTSSKRVCLAEGHGGGPRAGWDQQ